MSARATTVQVNIGRKSEEDSSLIASAATTSGESKTMARKMYYLSCLACRWTSRDVGIPDQTSGKINFTQYKFTVIVDVDLFV